MKELNQDEIMEISGAGIFGDIGRAVGGAIGNLIDSYFPEASSLPKNIIETVSDWFKSFF